MGPVLIAILMTFLTLFYKVQCHLETMRVERIQADRYKYWRQVQRYRKLLNSKRHIPTVQQMKIVIPPERENEKANPPDDALPSLDD